MTTIAWRDGVLAGDGRITIENDIVTDTQRKVSVIGGYLFGWCGTVEQAEIMRRHLVKDKKGLPKLEGITCILVEPNGTPHIYEGNIWNKISRKQYHAIGSGAVCALSAMDAGASAKEAVKIAIKRNVSTGGRVTSVSLKKGKKKG